VGARDRVKKGWMYRFPLGRTRVGYPSAGEWGHPSSQLRVKSGSGMRGFTLIELLIVVTIAAILVAIGVPSLRDLILKNRLRGAAEEAQAMLQFARSEAVKRREDVYVNFKVDPSGTPWCFGTAKTSNCDCEDVSGCVLAIAGTNVSKRVRSIDYTGVTADVAFLSGNHEVQYGWQRGLPTINNGTITFNNDRFEIQVKVSALGRVKMCSPSDTATKVFGYDDC